MLSPNSKPGNRLEKLGYTTPRRKPEGGPRELTARHRLLIDYMIDGCQHQSICDRIWVERSINTEEGPATIKRRPKPGEALTLIEAADLLRIRRRNARELMTLPIFKHRYDQELRRFREGERAASLHTLVTVRDNEGAGKAADRKVRMQAAQAILGEGDNRGTSVNINMPGSTQIVAGVVIRLPTTAEQPPLERARIIDHEDA